MSQAERLFLAFAFATMVCTAQGAAVTASAQTVASDRAPPQALSTRAPVEFGGRRNLDIGFGTTFAPGYAVGFGLSNYADRTGFGAAGTRPAYRRD